MNLLERLTNFIKSSVNQAQPTPRATMLNDLLTFARRGQFNEQYDEALKLFDEAYTIAREMNNPTLVADIQLHQADIFIAQGNFDRAQSLLNMLLEHCKKSGQRAPLAYTIIAQGTMAQAQGDWATAREHYEQAETIAREAGATGAQGRAVGHLGDTYLQEGNAAYAIHLIKSALPMLRVTNDNDLIPYFLTRLASAYFAAGQSGDGDRTLIHALSAANLLSQKPVIREMNLRIGQQHLKSHQPDKAERHLREALKLFGDHPEATPAYVDALTALAQTQIESGHKQQEVIILLERAQANAAMLADSKRLATVRGWLGLNAYQQGDFDSARTYFDQSLRDFGEDLPPLALKIQRQLATIYADKGDIENARTAYKSALKQAETHGQPHEMAHIYYNLGHLEAGQRDYQAAFDYWTQALSCADPVNPDGLVSMIHCQLGSVRWVTGQGRHSIKDYETALEKLATVTNEQARAIVLTEAADAYARDGDITSAEAFITEAIEISLRRYDQRQGARCHMIYGKILTQIGDTKPALTALNDAVELFKPLNAMDDLQTTTVYLTLAHLTTGDYSTAISTAEGALNTVTDPAKKAQIHVYLADAQRLTGDITAAQDNANAALALSNELRSYRLKALASLELGTLAIHTGDYAGAEQHINTARTAAGWVYDKRLIAQVHLLNSRLLAGEEKQAAAQKEWDTACQLLQALRSPIPQGDGLFG